MQFLKKGEKTYYWVIPLVSAFFWWLMLVILIAWWAGQGKPVYSFANENQTFMYISDVAATYMQGVFISFVAVQGLFFAAAAGVELYLRYIGELRPGMKNEKKVRWCYITAFVCAIIGQLFILLVSIFNTHNFGDEHVSFLVLFLIFIALSAVLSGAGLVYLELDYPRKRHIVVSLACRCLWFCCELGLVIGFGVDRHRKPNSSAVCEWVLAFIYPLYQVLMAWDLWPSNKKERGHYKDNGPYPTSEINDVHNQGENVGQLSPSISGITAEDEEKQLQQV